MENLNLYTDILKFLTALLTLSLIIYGYIKNKKTPPN